eukprot:CAMPEP_0177693526 /NCGR_PEP_ID=MMETSP0484_2-20121128/2445_1 /TAXON_ID=354590 /ORGANISM="Rhodomonas lens, Strain RHODO" /LENGTH=230 /DNA_ID=CAMNT_0019204339 /DNA_START=34 /DNA_END=723 /DNA_ORIENTATION=+
MATLMEFATMQLERNRGTRNAPPGDPGSLPQPDPVVHWGSEGRSALETDGKRKAKLLVICTHGGASLAVQDAFDPEKMTEIGAVMFAGPALKGSSLAQGFRSGSCSVWSSKESDGTVLVFMGSEVADDRAYGVAKAVVESIVAEKTLILDASPIQAVDSAADQPSSPLETGLVLGGLGAALLSALQLRARHATLFLGLNAEPFEAMTKFQDSTTVSELSALLRAPELLPA